MVGGLGIWGRSHHRRASLGALAGVKMTQDGIHSGYIAKKQQSRQLELRQKQTIGICHARVGRRRRPAGTPAFLISGAWPSFVSARLSPLVDLRWGAALFQRAASLFALRDADSLLWAPLGGKPLLSSSTRPRAFSGCSLVRSVSDKMGH